MARLDALNGEQTPAGGAGPVGKSEGNRPECLSKQAYVLVHGESSQEVPRQFPFIESLVSTRANHSEPLSSHFTSLHAVSRHAVWRVFESGP